MSRPLAWMLVLILFGVFAGAAGFLLRARADAGKGMPAYSIYSHDAYRGVAEAGYVLQRVGWTPVAVTRPLQTTRLHGLLIVAEPEGDDAIENGGSLNEAAAKAMLKWVEQGNTLLVFSRKATAFHQALAIQTTVDATSDVPTFERVHLNPVGPSDCLREIRTLSVGSRSSLSARPDASVLWTIDDEPAQDDKPATRGGAGACVLRRGEGRVILVADPSLLTHAGLWQKKDGQETLRDDNVMFLVNAATAYGKDGAVYFDEYDHGFHSGDDFWGYLRHYGKLEALPAFLLAVGALLWLWAVRLGPAVPTPRSSSADAVDYASALARLYQQAGARRLLGRTLARGFLDALTRQLRMRRNALPAEILAAWRDHDPGASMQRLQGLLRGVMELRRGAVSERDLLNWTQEFDQFVHDMQAVERSGSRRRPKR